MESNAATRASGPPGAPLARTQAVSGGSRTSQLAERDRDEAGRASEAEAGREHFSSADRVATIRPDRAAPFPLNATTILFFGGEGCEVPPGECEMPPWVF